jgi:hypothetical protein
VIWPFLPSGIPNRRINIDAKKTCFGCIDLIATAGATAAA